VSAERRRIATSLVLAHYVLALTVGASFHFHGHYRRAADCAEAASGSSPDAAELPGSHASGCAGCSAPQCTATDGARLVCSPGEECPVCQFLAQKPVPGQSVRPVECPEPVEHWVPAKLIRRAGNSPSTHPIRGPPAVA
jgi:hypothetical protein